VTAAAYKLIFYALFTLKLYHGFIGLLNCLSYNI